jgi:uncharacterized protein with GYD domain
MGLYKRKSKRKKERKKKVEKMDTKMFKVLKTMGTKMPAIKKRKRYPLLLQIF